MPLRNYQDISVYIFELFIRLNSTKILQIYKGVKSNETIYENVNVIN